MKAIVFDRPGPASALRLADIPESQPAAGQVRVRMRAVGLNPADHKLAGRGHPNWATLPHVLGLDGAGVVDALGVGVSGLRVGDRVLFHGSFLEPGCFAESACVDARVVAPLPPTLSFEAAAALPCAGMTALQVVRRKLRLEAGSTLLVLGASGGVGGFSLQLARLAGVRVMAVASAAHHARLRALGAEALADYRQSDLFDRVRDFAGSGGLDAVIDLAGPSSVVAALPLLAHGGQMACVAGVPSVELARGRTLHHVFLGGAYTEGSDRDRRELADLGRELAGLVADGRVDPMLNEVVAFAQLPAALQALADGGRWGKTVARL